MKRYLISFFLGFLACVFLALLWLSTVEIPTYIFEVECKPGVMA